MRYFAIRNRSGLGHVPVPYSGSIAPDGHGNHIGAWSTDAYYADPYGTWTDTTLTSTNGSRVENRNVPGDGKFDQSSFPADLTLAVGRVDLWNMSQFPKPEVELLRQYLNKEHAFRFTQLTAMRRGLVDDHFGEFGGEAFAGSGYRNFSAFFGSTNVVAAPYFSTLETNSYLWSYACGGGSYTSASGVGDTMAFVQTNTYTIFTMLFGSYFGDWDSANNFMRAQLANAAGGLSCVWAGRPHWQLHHMGLGETLGYSALRSQNYYYSSRSIHVTLLGDPSLRMHPVAPAKGLLVKANVSDAHELTWVPSSDTNVVGYHVYGANSANGPFTRLNTDPIAGTNYTDSVTTNSVYMVRAVKLETSGSGTYFNASQGIREDLNTSIGVPEVAIAQLTNGATMPRTNAYLLSATSFDLNDDLTRVEFFANGNWLGTATNPPFQCYWTTMDLGNYALTAVATDAAGLTATSSPVNITVTFEITRLVTTKSIWKYDDTSVDYYGAGWQATNYDDSAWLEGAAQLGFGDGDEATPISADGSRISTYFRQTFIVPYSGTYIGATIRLLRDDGGVVYLNGTEVFRSNMTTNGPILWDTQAASNALTLDETTTFYDKAIDVSLLHPGTNVLAVEIHQYGAASSDLSFNLELIATNLPPYMNTPPVISSISDQSTYQNILMAPVPLIVGDAQTYAAGLIVTGYSSDATLVPFTNIFVTGTGSNRTVSILPATNKNGVVNITMSVSDGLTNATSSFQLTIVPVTSAPIISQIYPPAGATLTTNPLTFTVNVSDAGGDLQVVEYYVDALKIGERTNAPYNYTWAAPTYGFHSWQARAGDFGGSWTLTTNRFMSILTNTVKLLASGTAWKYNDTGNDLGTAWRGTNYNDTSWASGPSPLGYGAANLTQPATTNSYGPDSANKYTTTYYRSSFVITNVAQYTNLVIGIQRDDGAVVYLNGTELFRTNMPSGALDYYTFANVTVGGTDEDTWYYTNLFSTRLREGTNVLAAEIHQVDSTSSDIFFNLELTAQRMPPAPSMTVASTSVSTNGIGFGWPEWAGGISLWSSTNVITPVWTLVTNGIIHTNGEVQVIIPSDQRHRFFRLMSQ